MKVIVVYESHYGNTAAVAKAIAEGFGSDAQAVTTDEAPPTVVAEADLVVAGAPVMAFRLPSDKMLATMPGDTEGEIKRMFVRPTARGLGVGRAIIERLIDDGRGLGFETIYLESASFMHSAHALYRSVGFAPSEPYPGREFEGAPHDVSIFMRLDLA